MLSNVGGDHIPFQRDAGQLLSDAMKDHSHLQHSHHPLSSPLGVQLVRPSPTRSCWGRGHNEDVCVCVSVNLLYNSHTSPYTAWWGILNKTELLSTAIYGCLNAAWLEYALRTKPLFKCFSFLCRIHNSLEVVRAS